mmetsp:Transcript_45880/g.51325  ORF Transcript_45880/g.51325 Transcript_45880/m.51325 type:complete len:297 (+) Transcript_45880:1969-2859(+)
MGHTMRAVRGLRSLVSDAFFGCGLQSSNCVSSSSSCWSFFFSSLCLSSSSLLSMSMIIPSLALACSPLLLASVAFLVVSAIASSSHFLSSISASSFFFTFLMSTPLFFTSVLKSTTFISMALTLRFGSPPSVSSSSSSSSSSSPSHSTSVASNVATSATACSVFPNPMQCASTHPLFSTTTLRCMNLIPSIWWCRKCCANSAGITIPPSRGRSSATPAVGGVSESSSSSSEEAKACPRAASSRVVRSIQVAFGFFGVVRLRLRADVLLVLGLLWEEEDEASSSSSEEERSRLVPRR